ncbi:rev protein [Simian immunodeficiency virus]|uniref:Protein Rev n=1 Tax=Simian immunodeficiency virus agm.vervet (isolate AGM155) TaxID=11727 RepID=REV_SIVV1|nr:RecName: Full=Protein Rev; AltName: Full=Regulator of expression of viral proteins [Simian immunodeficiency virus (AGM155 ISOLATE)]AAA91910.1 rev protein [Simian immunodeficiency virus]
MPLGPEERRLLRLIAFLYRSNPYPSVEGTARQRRRARRRWKNRQKQIYALAERIWGTRQEDQLVQAIDQLVLDTQHLVTQQLPDPPSQA